MRKRDILHMCFQNLRRRKSRTILTVLGVFIGCCAIVVMVSLGFGTREAQEKMLAQMGDLTVIEVYPDYSGSESALKLDDAAVAAFEAIDGVELVMPKLSVNQFSVTVYAGLNRRYVADWSTVMGINMQGAEQMGYSLLEGQMPTEENQVLVGQYMAYNFRDTMRPEGYNRVDRYSGGWDEEGNLINVPDAYFDPLEVPLTIEITDGERTWSLDVEAVGMTVEDYNKGYETSEGLMLNIEDLQAFLNRALAEQAAANPGGTQQELTYDSIQVKAESVGAVADAEAEIQKLGYSTYSMESIRKPLEEEAQQRQLLLGGLGAISLFVAAIGIANTMIMSVSERTREIGVMKALGCYVRDIRFLFLSEAGAIGLIGGIVGCIFSFCASVAINIVSWKHFSWQNVLLSITGGEEVTRVSVVPPWLLLFAIGFSVLIGLASGYYPARRAMRVSALEAIRSE